MKIKEFLTKPWDGSVKNCFDDVISAVCLKQNSNLQSFCSCPSFESDVGRIKPL